MKEKKMNWDDTILDQLIDHLNMIWCYTNLFAADSKHSILFSFRLAYGVYPYLS